MDDETLASYESAGFGQAAPSMGIRPAVVVVDMCAAYFTAGSPLNLDQPAVIDAVIELVAVARDHSVPVLWTRVEFTPGVDNGVWYDKLDVLGAFDAGNPLADWLPALTPASGDIVVTKQHASGFFGTDLAAQLHSIGADSVLIAGVSTSGCVRATATDASASGFIPLVVSDAVGDRTEQVHQANLFDLAAKYADVISLADVGHHLDTISTRTA